MVMGEVILGSTDVDRCSEVCDVDWCSEITPDDIGMAGDESIDDIA